MEIAFSPEMQAKLDGLAAEMGRSTDDYVRELVQRYVDEDSWFRAAVREGFQQLDEGDFIEEEEMEQRVGRMLSS